MTGHRPFKTLANKLSPERRQRVTARVAELKTEMALAELRQARERSQQELARALKVKQPAVAKLEKRTDMYVSNLRRYIQALGGSLEITATFPEGRVSITNFSDLGKSQHGQAPPGQDRLTGSLATQQKIKFALPGQRAELRSRSVL